MGSASESGGALQHVNPPSDFIPSTFSVFVIIVMAIENMTVYVLVYRQNKDTHIKIVELVSITKMSI